jgi:hypothetical protein
MNKKQAGITPEKVAEKVPEMICAAAIQPGRVDELLLELLSADEVAAYQKLRKQWSDLSWQRIGLHDPYCRYSRYSRADPARLRKRADKIERGNKIKKLPPGPWQPHPPPLIPAKGDPLGPLKVAVRNREREVAELRDMFSSLPHCASTPTYWRWRSSAASARSRSRGVRMRRGARVMKANGWRSATA